MKQSPKELAFLRDLYVSGDWTEKFTNLADTNLKFPKEGKILYFNAATGNHALALREKLNPKKVEITAVSENEHLQAIAKAKADIVKAEIVFESAENLAENEFDYVLADLSFTEFAEIPIVLKKLFSLTKEGGEIAIFAPTAGSFGEIYSYLWETLAAVDLAEKGAAVETLINRLPTISDLEDAAKDAGLQNVESVASREIFEYPKTEDFINSPMMQAFFFPKWFEFLTEAEKKKTLKHFPKIADEDLEEMSFIFSVKAALIEGKKI